MPEFRLTQISDTHLTRRHPALTDNFHRVSEYIDATRPDGSTIHPVMPAGFGAMTDTELKALWSYLTSIEPAPTGKRT